jgi:hypothetical protein
MITTDALKYLAHRFLAIAVLLDVKDIPQVGPLRWGRITVGRVDGVVRN